MSNRFRLDRFFDGVRPTSLLTERRRGSNNRSPISKETFDRIPDQFKTENERDSFRERFGRRRPNNNNNNNHNNNRDMPPRSTWSSVIFAVAIVAAFMFGYQAFFMPKATEITWTAFNKLLDGNQIESGQLKGERLVGELRGIPKLEYWPDILPNGKSWFESAIAQFDRLHPQRAEELKKELEAQVNSDEITIVQNGSSFALKLKDGSVFKTIETVANPTEKQCDDARVALVESYKLSRQILQRWRLSAMPMAKYGPQTPALQMTEIESGKQTGRIFFKKYSCEAPTFAYADQSLDARLRERLDSYSSSTPSDGSSWVMLLSVAVSVLFLVFLFRMMRSANEQFMSGGFGFGGMMRSLAKRYEPAQNTRVTFADVAGMDVVKAELVEIVDYLKNPAKYERMGARVPKGTLLFGPPGTGKTLLARAVAGEAGVPFFSINGSEFIQMFVGVGASRVRDIFATAKENAPSILFIDEIDAVGRQRGAGVGGGQDEREQTLNQILSEMDGFTPNDSVMVMASTNRPDVLDPALMRPGRFDRHITVGRPSMKGRVDIFKVYLKKIPYASNVDVDKLAKQTSGFTGADIRNFVNEATLWATRNNKDVVEQSDFDFAFEKIALGLKRDEIITPEVKRKTAYHEAGHALVGWFMPDGSKVHKITIIPRGRALGVTWSLPDDDRVSYSETEARATLAHFLAGRAAEKLIYSETSSGVENDLQRATELARNMAARWGMSDKIGPVAFPDTETNPFLGREMTTDSRSYSQETAKLIDEETKRIIDEADEAARNLLIEKRDLFENLTEALVAEEELDAARIAEILGPSPNDKPKEEESAQTDAIDLEKDESEGDELEDDLWEDWNDEER